MKPSVFKFWMVAAGFDENALADYASVPVSTITAIDSGVHHVDGSIICRLHELIVEELIKLGLPTPHYFDFLKHVMLNTRLDTYNVYANLEEHTHEGEITKKS